MTAPDMLLYHGSYLTYRERRQVLIGREWSVQWKQERQTRHWTLRGNRLSSAISVLAVPGIDVARCATGQSPFALACAHGRVDALKVLLHTDRVDINASGLGHPPICQAVEHGKVEAVRLLVQQGGLLQINRRTMTGHDTALCIAARDGSLDLVRALLRHDQIDPNLENRSCQGPLSLAAQRAHPNVVEALLLDGRLSRQSMTAALHTANNDSIRKLILTKIGDTGVRKLPRSPRCRFGAFQAGV